MFIKSSFELISPLFVGAPELQAQGAEFVVRVFGLLGEAQRDWVGLYWRASVLEGISNLEGISKMGGGDLTSALVVGPYWGPPTPHTIISEQKGLCGRAIRENRTMNIDDVTRDADFLACSVTTKSEIVIPIARSNGEVVAELDIDSNQFKAFDKATQVMLEEECRKFGGQLLVPSF
jgi:putative methionine-R-sulfoxide reductase with GAF domain